MSNCVRLDRESKNRTFAFSLFLCVARASFDTNRIGSNFFPTDSVGVDTKKI